MSFFRQSSWMIFCNTGAGVLMLGVHFLAPSLQAQEGEYGLFAALLGMLTLMMSPTPGIQTVFTHETAVASTDEERGRMVWHAMGTLKVTFILWLVVVLLLTVFHRPLFAFYKMDRAWPLVITLLAALLHLWLPVFMGILQGAQRFSWLGGALITNGAGRLLAAILFVALLGGSAQSVMLGVLAGGAAALCMAFAAARPYLSECTSVKSHWGSWAKGVLPLALAPIVFQVMMSADTVFFRSLMSKTDSNYYGLAGTMARGLVMLLGPLAGVMFPKLVSMRRQGQANSLLVSTLLGTAVIGGGAFLFLLAMSLGWPVLADRLVAFTGEGRMASLLISKKEGIDMIMQWVPWFAAGMLFLSCSNVLLSNLLAHRQYRVLMAPFTVVIAYLICLAILPSNGNHLVQLIFLFNLILLLVLITLVWWTGTWRGTRSHSNDPVDTHE